MRFAILACIMVAAPSIAGATPKLSVHGPLAARMSEKVKRNGVEKTRAQILEMFDPDSMLEGIRLEDLVSSIEDSEAPSLDKLPKKAWMKSTTESKLLAQRSDAPSIPKPKLQTPSTSGCTPSTCSPKDKEVGVRWDKQRGDEDVVAAYTSLRVNEETPDSFTTNCNATWDNGVYILGDKTSVVRFNADVSARASGSASTKASLYVLGQATPTWSRSNKVDQEVIDQTFSTPKVTLAYTIVPLVTLEGSIRATTTLSLKPLVQGSATTQGAQCGLGITPRLVASVTPDVKLAVGIKKIAELAKGGVRATLDVIDARVPTKLAVSLREDPLSLDLGFKSDVQATFMKGKLEGWYKLPDVCTMGFCLLEDGLGISTSGEIQMWEADGFDFNQNLVDVSGPIAFTKTSAIIDPMRKN